MPFVAAYDLSFRLEQILQIQTFDPKTCGTLSDRSKSMFNLNKLPTWGEDSKGIAIK